MLALKAPIRETVAHIELPYACTARIFFPDASSQVWNGNVLTSLFLRRRCEAAVLAAVVVVVVTVGVVVVVVGSLGVPVLVFGRSSSGISRGLRQE